MSWPTMTDYQEAIQHPASCFAGPELRQGAPVLDRLGLPKPITGGFASVYQMRCGGRRYAVRCFLRYHPDQERRYAIISRYLAQARLPYMVGFAFLTDGIRVRGQWYPALKMEWVDGTPLDAWVAAHAREPERLRDLAGRFAALAADLGRCGVAHGDLQHGNVLVVGDELRLIDYDGMYVPGLAGMGSHELGHRNYQHPRRGARDFGPHLDRFSTRVIYTSLVALAQDGSLWQRLDAGDEQLLFRMEDFDRPAGSAAFAALAQAADPEVRALGAALRTAALASLDRVPPLDARPARPSPEPPSWIFDHLQPAPVRSAGPRPAARQMLGAYGVAAVAIALLASAGALPAGAALLGLGGGIVALAAVLVAFYAALPEVSAKHRLVAGVAARRMRLWLAERRVARLARALDRVPADEARRLDAIARQQEAIAARERARVGEIGADLARLVDEINARRRALAAAQAAAIAAALRKAQAQALAAKLRQFPIAPAQIRDLDGGAKQRLQRLGVRTAADVLDARPVHSAVVVGTPRGSVEVDGLSPEAARGLVAWRRGLERLLAHEAPRALRPEHEARIRSRHARRHAALDRTEAAARRSAQAKADAFARTYRREHDALTRLAEATRRARAARAAALEHTLDDARREIAERHWALTASRRELGAYRGVTLAAFVRRLVAAPQARS